LLRKWNAQGFQDKSTRQLKMEMLREYETLSLADGGGDGLRHSVDRRLSAAIRCGGSKMRRG